MYITFRMEQASIATIVAMYNDIVSKATDQELIDHVESLKLRIFNIPVLSHGMLRRFRSAFDILQKERSRRAGIPECEL